MKGLGRDQSRDSKHSRNNMKKVMFLLAVGVMCLTACAQKKGGERGPRQGGHMEINKDSDSVFVALKQEALGKFKQLTFNDEQTGKTMEYNLLVPEGAEAGKKLPLVLFMVTAPLTQGYGALEFASNRDQQKHPSFVLVPQYTDWAVQDDCSTAGKEVTAPLTQGYGALEFASNRDQQKHPSFVLVPQYTDWAVQDDWSTTDEVEMTIRLLQTVCKEYNVDTNRLYTTGQSMGGMMSFYFNITHPDLFAASLFVSSQWDTSKMQDFGKKHFFYIVAGGECKASKRRTGTIGRGTDSQGRQYQLHQVGGRQCSP